MYKAVVVLFISIISCVLTSEVVTKMESNGIVPDVIDIAPPKLLEV